MKHTLLILASLFILAHCKESPNSAVKVPEQTKNMKSTSSDFDTTIVLSIWSKIISAIQKNDYKEFDRLSLDTITACNHKMLSRRFIESCSSELVTELFLTRIKDTTKIDINNREVISSYYPKEFLSHLKSFDRNFSIKRVQVDLLNNEPYIVAFDFMETKDGFRFFSCDVYGGPECCH